MSSTDPDAGLSRRAFLRGTAVTAGSAAASSAATAQQTGTSTGTGTATGTGTGTTTGTGTGNETGTGEGTGTGGGAAGGSEFVIDMTDELVYDPDGASVPPGTTVVWENVGDVGHSVTAYGDEIPEEAAYFASGEFDSEEAAREAYPEGDIAGGESYSHTFETEGEYGYFCIPHESAGMVASLTVSADATVEGGGAGAAGPAGPPQVPDSALTIGIATTIALTSVLALTYVFLRFGGDYPEA